ncbi:MAG: response regulator [Deltaproteobacteria bacterium]|jgi:HD-like signal output (HDOD) protein
MKRILFIDDEPGVLNGIRNTLRRNRCRWEMTFAVGGKAGIEQIERNRYDVVVTDMKMPVVGGEAVLEHLRSEQPDVVRIVLSGYTELESALRAAPLAHQMLAKPCRPEDLLDVIERACGLRKLITDERVSRAIGATEQLPSLPTICLELNRILADPQAGAEQVAELIEQDVALSARVLQMVNSSFFSSGRVVASIGDAVVRLGTSTIKSLVLTFELLKSVRRPLAVSFSLAKFEARAVATARLAQRIADDASAGRAAFLAGMLHDTGELVLASQLPETFEACQRRVETDGVRRRDAEFELLGVTHAEVGAYLMGLWGLPYPVVEAIAHHHQPSRLMTDELGVAGVVHVASALVDSEDLDDEFIERCSLSHRVEEWKKLYDREFGP